MTIFELLARKHGEIDALFRQTQDALAASRADQARTWFDMLSTSLIACMRAENAVVYPRFAHLAGLEDEVIHAIREHDRIEQAVNHLRLVPLTLDAWQGALTRLQVLVCDHVETEEWILCPVARLRLTTAEATKLGEEFAAYEPIAASVASPSITYDMDARCDLEWRAPTLTRFEAAPPPFLIERAA